MGKQKNECQCPPPGGGIVECEEDQLAVCVQEYNQPRAKCISPPAALIRLTPPRYFRRPYLPLPPDLSVQYYNWVLKEITGISRSLTAPLSGSDKDILR